MNVNELGHILMINRRNNTLYFFYPIKTKVQEGITFVTKEVYKLAKFEFSREAATQLKISYADSSEKYLVVFNDS